MTSQQDVEIPTVDGITLHGRLFPAAERGLGVVMASGFNATKEMMGVQGAAIAFQKAGITALTFDARGVGLSDGEPANDINPFRDVDDMSDALTFLSKHPAIDPVRGVGLWGMSLGAAIAMVTAVLEARARFVVAVCPASEIPHNTSRLPKVLAKASQDRQSRINGNEPFYLPMLNKSGENPAGFELGFEREKAVQLLARHDESDPTRASLAPNHRNRTTIGTYRYMMLWEPAHLWQYIRQPILYIVPEHDQVVGREAQLGHYERVAEPKRLHIQEGAAHMDILEGPTQAAVIKLQIDYMLEVSKTNGRA